MSYIDLYGDNGPIGRRDLPDHVRSRNCIYKIGYAIKKGGNGVVFETHRMEGLQISTDTYALKLLKQLDNTRVDRFNNEVRILKELDNPYISKYYDDGVIALEGDVNIPWVIQSLGSNNLKQEIANGGALHLQRLKVVVSEITLALSHLHERGFIHRDVKPDNFVWQDNSKTHIYMIDFGIAKRTGEDVSSRPLDNFTQTMEFVGPVFFSSPELIAYASNKRHPVDYRSDIFQLGKVIWFLATGNISAGVPSKRDCPYGGRLRDLVLSMIDDHPDDRIQSLEEIRNQVNAL